MLENEAVVAARLRVFGLYISPEGGAESSLRRDTVDAAGDAVAGAKGISSFNTRIFVTVRRSLFCLRISAACEPRAPLRPEAHVLCVPVRDSFWRSSDCFNACKRSSICLFSCSRRSFSDSCVGACLRGSNERMRQKEMRTPKENADR